MVKKTTGLLLCLISSLNAINSSIEPQEQIRQIQGVLEEMIQVMPLEVQEQANRVYLEIERRLRQQEADTLEQPEAVGTLE